MSYDNITVVAIYGNGQGESAVPALNKTAAALPGSRKLLITNEYLPVGIAQKLIGPLDYSGYSNFCMYALGEFINTDFALIVQHDGWALNPDAWKDSWLDYDYIGGLVHAGREGDKFVDGFNWKHMQNPLVVQNGGFSLRSKAFMQALTRRGIMPTQYQAPILNNEDVQLCCFLRPQLEAQGFVFAPNDEALMFSFEHLDPIVHAEVDITQIFGHHSRFRTLDDEDTMIWHLSEHDTDRIPMERTVHDLFKNHYKYNMRYEAKK